MRLDQHNYHRLKQAEVQKAIKAQYPQIDHIGGREWGQVYALRRTNPNDNTRFTIGQILHKPTGVKYCVKLSHDWKAYTVDRERNIVYKPIADGVIHVINSFIIKEESKCQK